MRRTMPFGTRGSVATTTRFRGFTRAPSRLSRALAGRCSARDRDLHPTPRTPASWDLALDVRARGAREAPDRDALAPRPQQQARALARRRSRRGDVVHEQHAAGRPLADRKRAPDVAPALRERQQALDSRLACLHEPLARE